MKFKIYRTSDLECENPPCEGAKLVRAGSMTDSAVYEIEIDTLEDLLQLKDRVGEGVIIGNSKFSKTGYKYEIEIYDDYRE